MSDEKDFTSQHILARILIRTGGLRRLTTVGTDGLRWAMRARNMLWVKLILR